MQIGDILVAISILFGIVVFIIDKSIERRDKTLVVINRLIDKYHALNDGQKDISFLQKRRFLGEVERVCIGIDSHVYSRNIVRKYASKFIVNLYDKNKVYIIEKTREQYKDADKYVYFEKLALKFKANK